MAILNLFDRPSGVGADDAAVVAAQYGGLIVYAATQQLLDSGIEKLSKSIQRVTADAGGLSYGLIQYLVERDLCEKVPPRCFGAILGRQLHLSYLDNVVCEASKGGAFRVYFSPRQLAVFEERTQEVARQLLNKKRLLIRTIRERYFAANSKGDWTRAMYIAARLVRRGLAVYDDAYTISSPAEIADALLSHSKELGSS